MTAPAEREPRRPAGGDTRCPPCRIGEHGFCDGNHDLPPVDGVDIRVPLQRCTCRHRRPAAT